MLDNLWFWTSDKLTSMKRRLVTSLAMNVARFTPIIKNLHGHNFQSSWRVVTQIGNLFPTKNRVLREGWFDCGGSRSYVRVLRV